MFEHAQIQKLATEAFTYIPAYVGQLAQDHWLVQYRDIQADLDDEDFFPENGEYLARSETDEQWFFAWKLENGRLMVAMAHYPEFAGYDGPDLIAEILPAGTPEQEALDWVKQRGIPESYAESDPAESAPTEEFISQQRQVPRSPARGNGRQPTIWERLFGKE